jgi:hypothetical protein
VFVRLAAKRNSDKSGQSVEPRRAWSWGKGKNAKLYKQSPHIFTTFSSRDEEGGPSGSNVRLEKNFTHFESARVFVVLVDILELVKDSLKVDLSVDVRLGVLGQDATNGKFARATLIFITEQFEKWPSRLLKPYGTPTIA